MSCPTFKDTSHPNNLVHDIAMGVSHKLDLVRLITGLQFATLRSLIGYIEVLYIFLRDFRHFYRTSQSFQAPSLKQDVVLKNMLPSIAPITFSHPCSLVIDIYHLWPSLSTIMFRHYLNISETAMSF